MIVLFNPRSTTPGKQPLPLSVLSLAAVLEGREAWALVDGNLSPDPAREILSRFQVVPKGELTLLGVTVMPGPQLSQAVEVCRRVRAVRGDVPVVWGGYFPTQHPETAVGSSFVDFVVRSQGERPLLELVAALRTHAPFSEVSGLTWKNADGTVVRNPAGGLTPLEDLPDVPYERLPMEAYVHPTYLGRRTVAHNSSFGCPFACSFCAVVAMTNRRWIAQTPARIERVLRHLVSRYRIDSVQMHDMDFFISESRVAEFADRIRPLSVGWWGLGRIDTLMQYSDATWRKMARSGLRMVFSGAESSSDATLARMNKGGSASAGLALGLARRMRDHGIVPEFSFVVGSPPDPEGDIAGTIDFIRRLKSVNPAIEVILYAYTPVPSDGALYATASQRGFTFPATLDEWASTEWRQRMLRRGDGLPWLDSRLRRRVRNFERVLNAFFPTVTDRRLTPARRALLKAVSSWRYALRVYAVPFELQALQRVMRYQRPETTGF